MKRAERDIARKKEFVRRVRLEIEEKRAEVSAACLASAAVCTPGLHIQSLTT